MFLEVPKPKVVACPICFTTISSPPVNATRRHRGLRNWDNFPAPTQEARRAGAEDIEDGIHAVPIEVHVRHGSRPAAVPR